MIDPPSIADLTAEETAEMDAILGELHAHGYRDVERHGQLAPGTRIRHIGHQWDEAYTDGTGMVVAVTEKPDSPWSVSWRMPDVELVAVWDRPTFGTRLAQLAQYHVIAVREGAA